MKKLKIILMGLFIGTTVYFGYSNTATDITSQAAKRYNNNYDRLHPITSTKGMVATQQHYATKVGLDILKKGGNSIDAAVAVAFALAVVLPNAGNIGGGGFLVLHDSKKGISSTIDFREMAPNAASKNMYLDENGDVIPGKSLFTHYSVGVPGTVAGLEMALKKYGTMSLAQVLAPAIKLAKDGFKVSANLANLFIVEEKNLTKWKDTRKIFYKKNGKSYLEGEILKQPELAKSLQLIAKQGSKAFYEGEIAKKIVAEMKKHGGLITLEDMKNYKAIERKPITGNYRGYEIITMPPPSSGGIHLVQILNTLEKFKMDEFGQNSANAIYHMAEAMKYAYADRSLYLGDPDFTKIPINALISKKYAADISNTITKNGVVPSLDIKPGNVEPYESDQTTHFSIVDKDRNVVAVTYTLNLNFGSGIVAEGTGILLNNEMDDFSAKPGVPNAFGLIGGEANSIEPKKRPLSSMTPTIVLKDGKPFLVTGSPGGARIITTVLQSITNIVDYKLNAAEAISVPRIHHQWLPDELRIEKGLSQDTIKLLTDMGYKVVIKPTMGNVQIIEIDNKTLKGFSDLRNPEGITLGY